MHLLAIPFVVAAGDVVHPRLVVEVPADGAFDASLELEGGFPAEFVLELGGVDGTGVVFHEKPVAHVFALAIDG